MKPSAGSIKNLLRSLTIMVLMILSVTVFVGQAGAASTYDFANVGSASGGFKPVGTLFLVSETFQNDIAPNDTAIWYNDPAAPKTNTDMIIKVTPTNLTSFNLLDMKFTVYPGGLPEDISILKITGTKVGGETVSVTIDPPSMPAGASFTLSGLASPPDLSGFTNITQLSFDITTTNYVQDIDFSTITIDNLVYPPTVAPTTQATNAQAAVTGSTDMNISWTVGNGASRVVFAKAGASTGAPTLADSNTYAANSDFSLAPDPGSTGWKCVYNGPGDFTTVTGLTAMTQYRFVVFEYNGTSGREGYLSTVAGNAFNQTTGASFGTWTRGDIRQLDSTGNFTTNTHADRDASGNVYVGYRYNSTQDTTAKYEIEKWDGTSWSASPLTSFTPPTGYTGFGNYAATAVTGTDQLRMVVYGVKGASAGFTEAKYNGTWSFSDIDISSATNTSFYQPVFAVDGNGTSHALYIYIDYNTSPSTQYLKLASWTGSTWNTQTIFTGSGVNSDYLLLNDSNNKQHVFYFRQSAGLTTLHYWTNKSGSGVGTTIFTDNAESPYRLSGAFDSSGKLHITYGLSPFLGRKVVYTSEASGWAKQVLMLSTAGPESGFTPLDLRINSGGYMVIPVRSKNDKQFRVLLKQGSNPWQMSTMSPVDAGTNDWESPSFGSNTWGTAFRDDGKLLITYANDFSTTLPRKLMYSAVSLTSSPMVSTGAAGDFSATTATLNGTVNANGSSTTVTFEYGTTTSYLSSPVTATQSPVTGSSNTAVSAPVSSLTCGTLYHFRVKAVNSGGTIYGDDKTFTIPCNTPPTFIGGSNTLSIYKNAAATDIRDLLHVSDTSTGQTETWTVTTGPSHGTLAGFPATANSGTADIIPTGTVTYQPTSGYTGSDSFEIQVSDGISTASRQIVVTVVGPPSTTVASAGLSADTGIPGDWTTNAASQAISGTLSANLAAGEKVEVSYDGGNNWSDASYTVGSSNWSTSTTTLSGSNTFMARVTNPVGSSTAYSHTYILDTTGSNITFNALALSFDTGSSASDFITKTAGQTITATLSSAPDGTDRVYGSLDNGSNWTDITANVSGGTTLSWSVTLSGSSVIKLKVTDIAGNDGEVKSQAYTLDITPPTTTIASAAFSADTGASSTDLTTNTAGQIITGTLSSALLPGEQVMVSLNNGSTWINATAIVGSTSWARNSQTISGSNTLQAMLMDVAGNFGPVYFHTYTLDTSAPTINSSSLAANDAYMDITFSEGVYGSGTSATPLGAANLNLTFTGNGGNAASAAISSVKKPDNTAEGSASALTGGETIVRVFLTYTGTPSGVETIEIKPAGAASIYDTAGNPMSATLTTGVKTLNDILLPTLVSAARTDDTHITVTLSENSVNLVKGNDGGFTVAETGLPAMTYAVSAIAQGTDTRHVVLTVADMGTSAKEGITVKYTAGGNGTVQDAAGNAMATDATGVTVAAWDTTPPTIASGSLSATNGYVDVTFSEGVHGTGDGVTPLSAAGLSITFTRNGGNATNAVISSVRKPDNTAEVSATPLAGGETTVRAFFVITGTPSGVETIEIRPSNASSIYDRAGNAMAASQTAGVKTLNDKLAPTLVSAVRTDDTHIAVTLSENSISIVKANNGGFTVTETGSATTYAVSSTAQGADPRHVVLTVADMGVSAREGITVTYTSGGNGSVQDLVGNFMATDATGVAVAAWDTTPPTITSGSLATGNTYLDVSFSEGVYGAGNGLTALTADKLAIVFAKNSGTATGAGISSVRKNDNTVEGSASALAGGETTVRVFLSIIGTPSGAETIEIRPANATAIYDRAGNATAPSQTTGAQTLNDQLAPSVMSVSLPPNSIYITGQNLDVTVNWSENVTVTGTDSTLGLIVGVTPRIATYLSKTATSITYRYTVQGGDLDSDGIGIGSLTLNTTSIKDAAGNNAVLTLGGVGATGGILVDTLVPTAKAANAISTSDFTASWDAVTGATGYRLDVSTSNTFASYVGSYNNMDVSSATSQAVTGLTAGTTYYYRVRAYNGNGTGASSNTASLVTTPAAPTATAASSVTFSGFTANWGNVTGAIGYYLDVATDSDFTNFVGDFNNKHMGSATTAVIGGLTGATTFHYRVRAYNSGGIGASSNVMDTTTATTRTVTNNLDSGAGSLRQTLADANPGDAVIFDPALNGQTITLNSTIVIAKDATISGPGAGNLTISGGNSVRIFEIVAGNTVHIAEVTLANGNCFDGPALFNHGMLSVTNAVITGNRADKSSGSGIYNNPGATLTVSGCTISGNIAGVLGGGVYNNQGTATISNTTITGNTASQGGGIFNNFASTLAVESSTISGNSASSASGGVFNGSGATAVISNSILWGNSGLQLLGSVQPVVSYSIVQGGYAGTGNLNADPLLGTLGAYGGPTPTMPLHAGSPALGAGDSATCTGTDQRGMARPAGQCDMGAYQRGLPAAVTAVAGDGQSAIINTPFATQLQAKVVDSLGGTLDGIGVAFAGPGSGAGIVGGSASTDAAGIASFSATANGHAGSYAVTATVAGLPTASYSLTNNPATQTITFNPPATATYGDSPITLSASATSGLPVAFSVSGPGSLSGNTLTITGAGNIVVTASQTGNADYLAATAIEKTIVVAKAAATVSLTPESLNVTYDGTTKAAAATTTPSGLTVTFTYDGGTTAPTNAGSYAVTATINDANYQGSTSGTLAIAKADQNITFPSATVGKVYGAADFGVVATNSSGLALSYQSSDTNVATIDAASGMIHIVGVGTGDGTTTITASQAGTINYKPASTTMTLGVEKALITVTADNQSRSAGAADPVFTASYSGFVNGETASVIGGSVTFTTTATAGSPQGSYDITPDVSGLTAANYIFTPVKGTLAVGLASQTITFNALEPRTYGAAQFDLAATSSSGLPVTFESSNSAVATITGNTVTITGAGEAIITARQVGNSSYASATAQQTLLVNKAVLTVQAVNQERPYNMANPDLTAASAYTYTGFVNGEDASVVSGAPSLATAAVITSPVGSYPITVAQGTLTAANYDFAFMEGTLAVGISSQSIDFAPLTAKTYGDAAFDLTATSSAGLTPITFESSNPAVATITGTTVTITGAGTATITARQAGNGSYAQAFIQRTLTVNKAPLTVTTQSPSRAYAVANPSFTPVYSGFKGSDTDSSLQGAPTIGSGPGTDSAPGSYPVSVTVGTLFSNNYAFTFADGQLTVTKAAATVTLGSLSQTYDGTAKVASVTTTPTNLAATVTYDGSATAPANAGSYTVVAVVNDTNYQGSASGILTINKAAQAITFNPPGTATYGDAPITLAASGGASGNAVALAVTSGPASLTGNVLTITGAGDIVVTASQAGSSNYDPAGSVQRTIAVGKAVATLTLGSLRHTYDGTAKSATATTSPAGKAVTFTYDGSTTAPTAAGTYSVVASINDANYQGSAHGTMTIGRSAQAITFGTAPAVFVGTTGTLSATATSGLAVSFTSTTPTICTVSGSTVTGVAPGICTIATDQAGNTNYFAAIPVTHNIRVTTFISLSVSALADGATTTETTQNVSGTVTNPTHLQSLTVNGVAVTVTSAGSFSYPAGVGVTVTPAGSFSYPVQLVAGANTITVIATSTAGDILTDSRTVTLDTTTIQIAITAPMDNAVVIHPYVTVSGTVTPATATTVTCSVNGGTPQAASISGGDFTCTPSLVLGMNTIDIAATDGIHTAQGKRTVTYAPTFNLAVTDPASDVRTVKSSYTLTGSVAENTTPVTVTITMDGQTYTPAVANDGTFSQTLTFTEGKVYQVTVTGTDQNGTTVTVQRNIIYSTPTVTPFTIEDALKALQMAVGVIPPQADLVQRLDVAPMVNGVSAGDGIIDVEDAIVILRIVVGLI